MDNRQFAYKVARLIAEKVVSGNGYTVSNAKALISALHGQSLCEQFETILKTKWHIRTINIPNNDKMHLFILDSYGENHVSKILDLIKTISMDNTEPSVNIGTIEGYLKMLQLLLG